MAPRFIESAPRRLWPALLTLIALASLVASIRVTGAAPRPIPPNPHGKFKGECGDCHGAEGWKPAKIGRNFDHGKFGFPLTGAHAAASCQACHASLDFTRQEKLCASCHEDPHRGEMGSACERCHTARSFVDHAAMTRAHQMTHFPLTGAHAALDCESCHTPVSQGKLQYVGTRADCQSCHMAEYQAAKQPDHLAGGFPLDCQECHTPISWTTARFDHSKTAFPLTGAHLTAPCASCHGDGVYKGKSTDCYSCHKANYDATNDPVHASAGFSTACATCHNTTSWNSASFNHNATAFPLTGAHATVACNQCHGDGVYAGKPTDCYSCHKADYDATNNPAHAAATFPTTCASCHNTTSWAGATFDHDTPYFPIYSGTHLGRWSACTDCHPVASNYASFNCLSCHPHSDKAQTDGNHTGVSGYVYDSNHCYSCHPRGRAG